MNKMRIALTMVLATFVISGCAADIHKTKTFGTAPIFSYLSLKDSTVDNTTPSEPLKFPASVAIVFAPAMTKGYGLEMMPQTTLRAAAESLKAKLLARSSYIKSVVIGHTGETLSLGQIRNMYGSDIIIILSYSQRQNAERGGISKALDITLVGGHLFPGVTVTTETGVEATVVHSATEYILFTEFGSDSRKTFATPGGVNTLAQNESKKGFSIAVDNLADKMGKVISKYDASQQIQVASLERKGGIPMKSLMSMATERQASRQADSWDSVNSYKSSGRGGLDGGFGLITIAIAAVAVIRRRK